MCLISEGHVTNYTFIAMGAWWLSHGITSRGSMPLASPRTLFFWHQSCPPPGFWLPRATRVMCCVPLSDPEAPSSSACSHQHKATIYFQAPKTPRSLVINLLQGWTMVIASPASFGRHYFCDLGHSHLPWQTTGRAIITNLGIHLSSQENFALSRFWASFWPLHSKKREPPVMAWPARNLLC